MPVDLATLFGYAGTFTGSAFMMPQLYRIYRTKSVEDISWGMLGLFFLNCVFWLTYGILLPAFAVALTNAIAMVVVILQLILKFLYRNNP